MKTARTIRTLNRCGIDPQTVGFAGFTPSGKAVRRMAKTRREDKRLLATAEGGRAWNWALNQDKSYFPTTVVIRRYVRACVS